MEAEVIRAILVGVALSCLVLGGTAAAEFISGNKLFEQCQGGDDPDQRERDTKIALCSGYIVGAADTLDGSAFCLPGGSTGVTAEQITDVVKLYLRDHPETRHHGASSLFAAALNEKFPCN